MVTILSFESTMALAHQSQGTLAFIKPAWFIIGNIFAIPNGNFWSTCVAPLYEKAYNANPLEFPMDYD
ncbi:MAG: hypothetical protein CO149_04745 [Nitrospirae bacterium CG_4_9_14_3_um_filter_51_5]|nr:MAG: hypothetical protein CO149_04745 [Nitrospirae bacterium CG_4_9_14_3_um_filter_51_5]